ncbi:MAG: aspartate ammonia-lyase [Deltaproteobacteria bacterium]|nr:aspartate ammonia-lyase [Deltaproteobacteria bacterium]MBI3296280.1 aspartate ammonia-lyase [Deltaproteobacteria bacterium]
MDRWEEDSLGRLPISGDAPYGIHTARALALGAVGRRPLSCFSDYVTALLDVKVACARANRQAGHIKGPDLERIEARVKTIRLQNPADLFPVDLLLGGGSIAINRNVNEIVGFPQANLSQSTADVCHTALRVALYRLGGQVLNQVDSLVLVIEKRAAETQNIPTIARTCLRDAMATTYGAYFSGVAAGLRRQSQELKRTRDTLLQVNLGGTVIGDGTGASAAYRTCVLDLLKDVTGIAWVARENLFDAAQNSDDLGTFSGSLVSLGRLYLKFAKDLRLLSSGPAAGLNEISLKSTIEGSSFFPGKINPMIPETVIQCAIQIIGNHAAVQSALEQTELNLNVFESVMAANLNDSLRILEQATRLISTCVDTLEINRAVCERHRETLS